MTEEEAAATIERINAERAAAYDAAQAAITPHVRKAPAKKLPRMSGPRHFNLMRAMEARPAEYAEYRPTNYCGAPLTTRDWSRTSALAKKNAQLVADDGVCPACLDAASPKETAK